MTIYTSLCIPVRQNQILLGMKKRGFGQSRWNGFGGKIMAGESIEDAAIRELFEESGLQANKLIEIGQLEFYYNHTKETVMTNIFKCIDFNFEPTESEEMRPHWFNFDQIPFDSMWPDDKYWLPTFISGKKFLGKFVFADYNTILQHELHIINT